MITPKDCQFEGKIPLADGRYLKIEFPRDCDHGAPWEENDCHGPIRIIKDRDQKRPGERILGGERWNLFAYDVKGATEIAKRDGWGLTERELEILRDYLKREPTKGEIIARAVESDANHLAGWINDRWTYVVISVELFNPDGTQIAADYLGGVESCGDYYAEQAAEMANQLIADHDKETAEAAYWREREVLTA
jgi:hypothetical protein